MEMRSGRSLLLPGSRLRATSSHSLSEAVVCGSWFPGVTGETTWEVAVLGTWGEHRRLLGGSEAWRPTWARSGEAWSHPGHSLGVPEDNRAVTNLGP